MSPEEIGLSILSGLALGLSIFAVTVAIQAKRRAERPARQGECHNGQDHDWLNWSAPVPMTVKVPASIMGGGEIIEHERFVQTRACTRCNLQQRAMS